MQPEVHALAIEIVDVADPVRIKDPFHDLDRRVVHEGVADHERRSSPIAGADDRFGVAHRLCERLLDKDVLPRGEGLLGELPMRADRRDDADGVDRRIVEELAVLGRHAHRGKALANGLEPLLREVRDRHGFRPRRLVEISHDVRAPVARTDHAHTNGLRQEDRILGFGSRMDVTARWRPAASRDRPVEAVSGGHIRQSRPP